MASLRFETGPRTGEVITLDKDKVTFGRHLSHDVVLKHPTVSRDHFSVEFTGGKYLLVDQNSGNGTLVNGRRVSWVEVKNGDSIQAGPFVFKMEMTADEQEVAFQTASIEEPPTPAERHREDRLAFDDSHAQLYPREYLDGIRHFNAGRYFEAHEIWEEIWLRSSGDAKLFYQTLIQAAVGLHHFEGGNNRGALGMHKNVHEKVSRLPEVYMSLDLTELKREFDQVLAQVTSDGPVQRGVAEMPMIRLLPGEMGEGSR